MLLDLVRPEESLRYVSLILQTMAKTFKMLPVMLLGMLISRKRHSFSEVLVVTNLTMGLCLFVAGGDVRTLTWSKDFFQKTTRQKGLLDFSSRGFSHQTSPLLQARKMPKDPASMAFACWQPSWALIALQAISKRSSSKKTLWWNEFVSISGRGMWQHPSQSYQKENDIGSFSSLDFCLQTNCPLGGLDNQGQHVKIQSDALHESKFCCSGDRDFAFQWHAPWPLKSGTATACWTFMAPHWRQPTERVTQSHVTRNRGNMLAHHVETLQKPLLFGTCHARLCMFQDDTSQAITPLASKASSFNTEATEQLFKSPPLDHWTPKASTKRLYTKKNTPNPGSATFQPSGFPIACAS